MTVEEHPTRLFYVRGEHTITEAYSTKESPRPVNNGKCLYLARVELASACHPELVESTIGVDVITTWRGISWNKQARRRSADPITFERLKEGTQAPNTRASTPCHESLATAISLLELKIRNHPPNRVFNLNLLIYSEYSGYWEHFGPHFDSTRTYYPLVSKAMEEVVDFLSSNVKKPEG